MKLKKPLVLAGAFIFASPVLINAQGALYLEDSNGNRTTDGGSICANQKYNYTNIDQKQELMVVDHVTHEMYEVFTVDSEKKEIVIPDTVKEIDIVAKQYEDGLLNTDSQQEMSLTVKECDDSNDQVSSYDKMAIKANFDYNDNRLKIAAPENADDYELKYRLVGEENFEKLKTGESKAVSINETENIVQVEETYTKNDVDVNLKYEVTVNPKTGYYYVREISNFDVSTIDTDHLVNKKLFVLLIILIIIYFVSTPAIKYCQDKYQKAKKENDDK